MASKYPSRDTTYSFVLGQLLGSHAPESLGVGGLGRGGGGAAGWLSVR